MPKRRRAPKRTTAMKADGPGRRRGRSAVGAGVLLLFVGLWLLLTSPRDAAQREGESIKPGPAAGAGRGVANDHSPEHRAAIGTRQGGEGGALDSALALNAGELGVIRLSAADVRSILGRGALPLLDLAAGSEKAAWPRVSGLFSRSQVKAILEDIEIRRPRVATESSLSGADDDFWSAVEILSEAAQDGSPVDFKMTFRGTGGPPRMNSG